MTSPDYYRQTPSRSAGTTNNNPRPARYYVRKNKSRNGTTTAKISAIVAITVLLDIIIFSVVGCLRRREISKTTSLLFVFRLTRRSPVYRRSGYQYQQYHHSFSSIIHHAHGLELLSAVTTRRTVRSEQFTHLVTTSTRFIRLGRESSVFESSKRLFSEPGLSSSSLSSSSSSMSLDAKRSMSSEDSLSSSSRRWSVCPVCHGEGKIAKSLSKKAKLRRKRQEQQQYNETHNAINNDVDDINNKYNNTKRAKRTLDMDRSTNNINNNNESGKRQMLSSSSNSNSNSKADNTRWEPCRKCDQTGLITVQCQPVTANSHQIQESISIESTMKNTTTATATTAAATSTTPTVAIVGGGLGGIALGIALAHRSINFCIYERDTHFHQRSQGYGLTMQQARRALRSLGIIDDNDDNNLLNNNDHKVDTDDVDGNDKTVLDKNNGRNTNSCDKNLLNASNDSAGEESMMPLSSSMILKQAGITSTKHLVHTVDGKVVGEWGLRKWGRDPTKKQPKRQNLHIARQSLRKALFVSLQEAMVSRPHESKSLQNSTTIEQEDDNQQQHQIRNENLSCMQWGHRLTKIDYNFNNGEGETRSAVDKNRSNSKPIKLTFDLVDTNGVVTGQTTTYADMVVGCDGIRSKVRQELFGHDDIGDILPLRYLDCVVVLGICQLSALDDKTRQECALLDGQTVFQTADGANRIYIMPFSTTEVMWQLSFPVVNETEAKELSKKGPFALKDEALNKCHTWHSPVPEILQKTPVEMVSGYPVYDRDLISPDILEEARLKHHNIPITLIGDAAHPMSPFKGQGANQALLDSLSLARSIYSNFRPKKGRDHDTDNAQSIESMNSKIMLALEKYEVEMTQRSAVKVLASSEAAKFLHTDVAIQEGDVTRGGAAALVSTTTSPEVDA